MHWNNQCEHKLQTLPKLDTKLLFVYKIIICCQYFLIILKLFLIISKIIFDYFKIIFDYFKIIFDYF